MTMKNNKHGSMSMELRARAFGPPELYYYSTKALRLLHTKLR